MVEERTARLPVGSGAAEDVAIHDPEEDRLSLRLRVPPRLLEIRAPGDAEPDFFFGAGEEAGDASVDPEGRRSLWREGPGGPLRLEDLAATTPISEIVEIPCRGSPRLAPVGRVLFEIAVQDSGSIVRVFDLASKVPIACPENPALGAILSPSGKFLARMELDGSTRVVNLAQLLGSVLPVRASEIAWIGDETLAVVTRSGEPSEAAIVLWDVQKGISLGEIDRKSAEAAWAISFDGSRLAAVWPDGRLAVRPLVPVRFLALHEDLLTNPNFGIEFSPGGSHLLQMKDHGSIRLWDLGTDRPLETLGGDGGLDRAIVAAAFLDDERLVLLLEDGDLVLSRSRLREKTILGSGLDREGFYETVHREARPERGAIRGDGRLDDVFGASWGMRVLAGGRTGGEHLALLGPEAERALETAIRTDDVAQLAFDSSESCVLVLDVRGTLHVLDPTNGLSKASLDLAAALPEVQVAHVASMDGGRTAIVGGVGGWAVVETATGRTILREEGAVDSLAVSTDRRFLAIGRQGRVQIVDLTVP